MKVIHKWLSLVLALTMVSYQMQPTTAFAMTDDGISEETATENVEVLNEESSGTITNETEPVVEEEPVVQEQPTVPENTEIVNEEIVEGNNNSEQTTTNVVDDVKEPEEEESKQQQTKNVTNENQLVQEQSEEPSNDEITWTNKGEFPFVTEVKIYNEDGTSIDEDSFDRNQKINLDFYFAIPNDAVVSAGDMYTINIPEGFELVGNLAEQQLDPASGIDVTWELTGNVITVRFYQSLDVISNVSGFMSIGCWFDKDSQLGQDGQDITFVIAGKTYTVDVYYDEITDSQSAEVAKKATYNKDTKEVTWTITVTPDTSHSTLAGVTVEDHYDTSKLDYVEGSFAVNGKSVSDNDVFFNSNGFEYQFPTGLDPGTKTITYKTKVTDEYFLSDSTAVTNNVSTYMPNGDKSSEAEANIQIEKLPMQKEAVSYNAITQTASWKITANRNKLNLKDATIVDEYSEGSYIDTDTIKVNGQKTTNFKVNESKHTLTIYLGDISDVVTITYDMVITDFDQFTKYDDTYYIWNYASLNSGTSVVEEAFGEGWIGVGTENIPIDKGGGVHIDDEYGQYIEWWVDINSSYSSDYKEINDPIVFYDKLPDGLTFMPWGMTITAYFPDGSHAIKYLDAEDVYNPETNEVSYTITPGMDFSGVKATPDCWYAIWFATSIDGVQEGSFTNKASVTVGNQTNSDSHTVDVSYKTEDMIGKSGSYNYEDKTYDWTIVFNKGEQAVLNPVITDTLPEGHAPAREFIYVDNQQVYLNGPAVNGIKATYDPNTNVITVSAEGYRLGKSNIKISTKYVGEGEQGDATNSVALDGDNLSHEFTATSTIKYKPLPVLEKKTNYTQGDTIKWQVVLNLDHDNLGKLSLVDQLSPGLSFDTSSVKLYYANVSSNGTVTATNDQIKINEKDVQYDNTTGLVTIYLPEDLDTHQCYVLEFNTDIQDKSLQTVTNSITFNGTDFQEGTTSDVVILKTTSSSSGIIGEAGTVKIKKLDEITNKPLEGVAFQLLNSNKEPITSAGWAVTNSEGIAEFKDWLRLDTTYYIQEVRTLQGYVYDDTMYEVKVNSKDESKVKEIVVYNTPDAKVNVEGTKTWDDGNNQDGIRPESITVNLLADGEVVDTAEVTAEDNWSYEFNNLPKYAEGKEIVYTVSEGNVKGYEAKVDGYNLTNTHKPETISVEGTKTWDDANNQDGIRPQSISVNLLADGEVVDTAEVTAEDNWSYEFNNLPKYAEGKEIVYTVSEGNVKGYEAKVDGYNLTNTHKPETISVEGTKTWDDANNQDGIRPESITVNLLADGEVVDTAEVTAEDNWSYEFNNLPKYAEGKEIVYTVSEEAVNGYEAKVDGYNLTNTHKPETISVEGTKTWDDGNNQDGIRPESITVNLLADGEVVDTAEVTAEDNWSYEFNNLPKYAEGKEIVYTVSEGNVKGYEAKVDGYNLTNTHKPETISVEGTKTWDDGNNQDGIRPESITVNLLADGEVVDTAEVTAEDGWKYSFNELPKYAEGKEIVYTVSEEAVNGYEAKVDGYNLTNTHKPETISVEGTKTWDDANNQDGIRPESITVNLLADGEVVDTAEITAEDGWKYSFNELPKYAEGKEIVYTISEEAVNGYEAKVDGFNLTNTHTPETISVEGTKTWDDGNNQDGIRPESITVNLLADGEVVDTAEITAEDGWKYSFNELPKYAEGKEIVYTISEEEVEGYEVKVDGFNLTNTHTPETISVEGTKTWDDGNNQDGIRPESITVNLLADGEVVDTAEITAEDGWKYSFNELPKYAEGKEIVYTVSEEEVEGYEVKVDGFNLTNTHTPETISVEGTKTWDDGNNQDGIRPESITVNLLADGEVVQTIEVTADDNWSYEFNELPKYAEGKEISYTISEEPVEGYKVKVDGYNLINTHTPEDKDDETTTTDDHSDNNTADTGVSTDITQWVTIGIVCLVVIILLTYKKLRTLK